MKNVHMCYIRVTERKIENLKKEGKMRISTLVFIYTIHFSYLKVHKMSFSIFIFIYTIHLAYLKVYTKFENTGSNRSREICDRNFHWRERKMNK